MMEWSIAPRQDTLIVRRFVNTGFIQDGTPTQVAKLLPRLITRDILAVEGYNITVR